MSIITGTHGGRPFIAWQCCCDPDKAAERMCLAHMEEVEQQMEHDAACDRAMDEAMEFDLWDEEQIKEAR